jgi:hypothetical protein
LHYAPQFAKAGAVRTAPIRRTLAKMTPIRHRLDGSVIGGLVVGG